MIVQEAFNRYVGIDYPVRRRPLRASSVVASTWRMGYGTLAGRSVVPCRVEKALDTPCAASRSGCKGSFRRYHAPCRYRPRLLFPLRFLEDFRRHWPTDDDLTYVDFVRGGSLRRCDRAIWQSEVEACDVRDPLCDALMSPDGRSCRNRGMDSRRYMTAFGARSQP